MQRQRVVLIVNGHFLLRQNITGICALHHAMQRDAGFSLAIDQRPVQRCPAAVFRQQGAMQVKGPLLSALQDLITQQMAIVEGEDHLWCHGTDAVKPDRMIRLVRCINRNTVLCRQAGYRAEKVIFGRHVVVRKNGGDLIACIQQGIDADTAHVVIGENNGLHD